VKATLARTRRTADGRSRPANASGLIADRLARAVRHALNLPRLRVEARRSAALKRWQVRLGSGARRSEWIGLDAGATAVMLKLGLLPPKLLGTFRLAYDSIRKKVEGAEPSPF
jgi:hypothetical protein